MIPSGTPGKFSTSVVVVSCPPAAMPLASHPSNRMGLSSARAAYIAAVWAAGPDPTMQTEVRSGAEEALAHILVVVEEEKEEQRKAEAIVDAVDR